MEQTQFELAAKDLLASLPALDYVPKVLETVEKTDLEHRQCISKFEPITEESPLRGITKYIGDLISDHQNEFYRSKGNTITFRYVIERNEENSKSFVLRTYVDRIDSLNRTTTYISESYNIFITSEKTAVVSGELTVHSYYGEDQQVNVQTKLVRVLSERTIQVSKEQVHEAVAQFEQLKMRYEKQLAKGIVNELISFKDSLDILETFESTDLKQFRRILPITKTRFKWDSSAQRNVQLLNARRTQKEL